MTTTAAEVDAELANRLVVLGVDEDRAQTRAVQAAQRRAATLEGLVARLGREPVIRLHRNAQRLLEPLPVVVPGAEELAFPDSSTRHRRDHQKLLSVIAAIALLHQYQRRQATVEVAGTPVRYVEASAEDVALGAQLCHEVLVRAADELSPPARRLLSVMESRAGEQVTALRQVSFTRRELRELTGWSEHQVRVGLGRLVALEYVSERRDRPGRRHSYVLADDERAGPREGPREVREPSSRGQLPALPGPMANLATFATTTKRKGFARRQKRRRRRSHLGAEAVSATTVPAGYALADALEDHLGWLLAHGVFARHRADPALRAAQPHYVPGRARHLRRGRCQFLGPGVLPA